MISPIFFPKAKYVPTLSTGGAVTLRQLCADAGIPCRASGAWCDRMVTYYEADCMEIWAMPGPQGSVLMSLPKGMTKKENARMALLVMAYGLFDGVARESVRGVDWARKIKPAGRPKSCLAMSNKERQRAWRARKLSSV